jgi:hypothetical protein
VYGEDVPIPKAGKKRRHKLAQLVEGGCRRSARGGICQPLISRIVQVVEAGELAGSQVAGQSEQLTGGGAVPAHDLQPTVGVAHQRKAQARLAARLTR